jgi:NDP-sugar pyrophosphorylase family protein
MAHLNGKPRSEQAAARAVILAGGRGRRLEPYTNVLPKPLMPIGNRAILEILTDQLRRSGFTDITLCVGYLSHLIRAVFDNGPGHGLNIGYVTEEEPLGTAAPLRLVEGLDDTFLTMNGDLLTTLDFGDFVETHRSSGSIATIATHQRLVKSDYGVLHLDLDGEDPLRVCEYEEKPEFSWTVSMGVYALEPAVIDYIPADRPFDFPELVQALLDDGQRVATYPYGGLWLDIGRHDDYERANAIWRENGFDLVPELTSA